MSGKDFRIQIVQAIKPSEKAPDLIQMIDVLAEARAQARGEAPGVKDYELSAKILCVVFDPVKPPSYRAEMPQARLFFRGIANQKDVEAKFRQAIALSLVDANDLEEIVNKSPRELLGLQVKRTTTFEQES